MYQCGRMKVYGSQPDGFKYVGEWKDERPCNTIDYDKNGNFLRKIVNGEIQE